MVVWKGKRLWHRSCGYIASWCGQGEWGGKSLNMSAQDNFPAFIVCIPDWDCRIYKDHMHVRTETPPLSESMYDSYRRGSPGGTMDCCRNSGCVVRIRAAHRSQSSEAMLSASSFPADDRHSVRVLCRCNLILKLRCLAVLRQVFHFSAIRVQVNNC